MAIARPPEAGAKAARSSEATKPRSCRSALEVGDFAFRGGRVYLRKTGNSAALDLALLREVAGWLAYQGVVRAMACLRRRGRQRRAIWFTPDVPHPRYMIRAAAIWAGINVAKRPQDADAAFFFEDATRSVPRAAPDGAAFNFRCTDISKSHVAATFEAVFGYPLAVDPRRWAGEAVEKSEANGRHDGRIVPCPREPAPGMVYQRLIDTIGEDGLARDLRTHCVGGKPIVVWIKARPAAARFLPPNLPVETRRPEAAFSDGELQLISDFCAAMGADWCGLDVLRDRDGRIYVVDVNKTDAGPITALPFRQKLAATGLLAAALLGLVDG